MIKMIIINNQSYLDTLPGTLPWSLKWLPSWWIDESTKGAEAQRNAGVSFGSSDGRCSADVAVLGAKRLGRGGPGMPRDRVNAVCHWHQGIVNHSNQHISRINASIGFTFFVKPIIDSNNGQPQKHYALFNDFVSRKSSNPSGVVNLISWARGTPVAAMVVPLMVPLMVPLGCRVIYGCGSSS